MRGRGTRPKGERGRVPDSRIFACVPLMPNLQTDAAFKTSTRCLMPLTVSYVFGPCLSYAHTNPRQVYNSHFICISVVLQPLEISFVADSPVFIIKSEASVGGTIDSPMAYVTADGHVLDSGLGPGNIPFIKCFLSGMSWQADLTLDLEKSNWQEWSRCMENALRVWKKNEHTFKEIILKLISADDYKQVFWLDTYSTTIFSRSTVNVTSSLTFTHRLRYSRRHLISS